MAHRSVDINILMSTFFLNLRICFGILKSGIARSFYVPALTTKPLFRTILLEQISTGRRQQYPLLHTLANQGWGQSLSSLLSWQAKWPHFCLFCFFISFLTEVNLLLDRMSSKSLNTKLLPTPGRWAKSRTADTYISSLLILTVKRGISAAIRWD